MDEAVVRPHPEPWNKGKLVGQKAPFKLKENGRERDKDFGLRSRAEELAAANDAATPNNGEVRRES
jgi:hypothetical protein